MFGLEDRHVTFIKDMLKKHISNPEAKFYIFGSRAKGNNRPYSDVDIAIDCPDLTLNQKLKLESDFENSTFPYEVDIVDLNTVKENFKNIIEDDLVELKINGNSYTLVYSINNEKNPSTVYVNLTNACTNSCIFCLRSQKDDVCGREMWHDDKYTLEDIIEQFNNYKDSVKEVVFCGYGEPFLKKDMMKDFCLYLRKNYPQIKIRVNTNGHANQIYKTNVAEEFTGLVDSVSISLNSDNEGQYNEICKPTIDNAYEAMKDFARSCKTAGMDVSMSVVTGFDDIHKINVKACEEIAKNIGATFRNREFITNGY